MIQVKNSRRKPEEMKR